MYVCTYVYMYVCMYVCVHMYVCMCMCACVHVYVYLCMYVCYALCVQLNPVFHKSIEINLCETGISGCQHLCVKTNGSFYCDCWTGYQLLSDNMTCQGYLLA